MATCMSTGYIMAILKSEFLVRKKERILNRHLAGPAKIRQNSCPYWYRDVQKIYIPVSWLFNNTVLESLLYFMSYSFHW